MNILTLNSIIADAVIYRITTREFIRDFAEINAESDTELKVEKPLNELSGSRTARVIAGSALGAVTALILSIKY